MRAMLTKSLVRNALLLSAVGAACVAAPQVGCSSGEPGTIGSGNSPSGDGTVGMRLTLPGGSQLNTVSWSITGGPTGVTAANPVQSGSVNVTNSLSVAFSIGGLPAGSNYLITLSGTTTTGGIACGGSAPFSVQAQATTSVTVPIECSTPGPDSGSAQVTATTFNCATVQSLSAVPTEVIVGNPVSLTATGTGPNPGALSYAWSAPSGTFSAPNSQVSNFTCSAAGAVTLTVTLTDGAVPSGSTCPTSTSTTVNVTCDGHLDAAQAFATTTKIKHLVVIFNENNSFDHYFGTYPTAQNNPGEPYWSAATGTPTPNNLIQPLNVQAGFTPTGVNLLTSNPTVSNSNNGTNAINPVRLAPLYAETASQNHSYGPEQQASDHGIMDLFPKYTGTADSTYKIFGSTNADGGSLLGSAHFPTDAGEPAVTTTAGLVMAYYDGNTLGTYWNWAQQYALSDNMWTTNFGPSSPGAVNVISGQTNGLIGPPTSLGGPSFSLGSNYVSDGNGGYSVIGDFDPAGDACEGLNGGDSQGTMTGSNIGMLLNAGAQNGITWGWFQGGFNLSTVNGNGSTGCTRYSTETVSVAPAASYDYIPHHNPFNMYPATSNLQHNRPTSTASIGYTNVPGSGGTADPANHIYDSQDFFAALSAGNLPAVSYLKPPAYQNGHPGNSDPIDEQAFANSVVTALQAAQEWSSSLVVITYDDSDGWYDHQGPPVVNESTTTADFLNGSNLCNSGVQQTADGGAATTMLNSPTPADGGAPYAANGRCAYGTRVPLLIVSPFAKKNYIDHTLVDQSSVVKFIEDNWLGSERISGSFDAVAGTIQNMLTGD